MTLIFTYHTIPESAINKYLSSVERIYRRRSNSKKYPGEGALTVRNILDSKDIIMFYSCQWSLYGYFIKSDS